MLKFLALILLIFGNCAALLHPPDDSPSKLTKLICDVSEEVSQEESRTMAMMKMQNSFPPIFFDDLHQCMPTDISMVQVDIESAIDNEKLKDAKFVVMIGDKIDASLMINLTDDRLANPILRHTAKFLFVSSSQPRTEKILEMFAKYGILNFAFAYEDKNGEICVEISNHFAKSSQILKDNAKLSELYPNKLANMHKTPIRALANTLMQNVKIQNGEVFSVHKNLLNTIADKLNATLDIKILDTQTIFETHALAKTMFENREVDITLGSKQAEPRILVSYVEFGYCALIPMASVTIKPSLYFLETFKVSTIALMLFTLGCIMVLWRIHRALGQARGSSWRVALGLISSFFGQSFTIRTTNFMMYSLIVLMIYAKIIMNNLYQATLTSEITKTLLPHQMQTFAELFESDNEFVVGIHIVEALETIPEYQEAEKNGRVTLRFMTSIEYPDKVTITRCDTIEKFLATVTKKSFYILPQKAYNYVTLHEMGYANPYTETFQDLVNRAFSAGLHQAWETFLGVRKFRSENEEESSMLTFENMGQRVMLIFPYAMAVQILVFLLEIFYDQFDRIVLRRLRRMRRRLALKRVMRRIKRNRVQPWM